MTTLTRLEQKIENILNEQSSLLHNAITNGSVEEVRNHIEEGVSINREYNNITPILIAVKENKTEIVKMLIDNGADINTKDQYDITPLVIALGNGNIEIANYLIEYGANTQIMNRLGSSVLSSNVIKGNVEIVELLMKNGMNIKIEATNPHAMGDTPLILAVRENNIKMVECLIKNGANIKVKNYDNETPLILAIQQNNTEMVKCLINNNADVNVENKKGKTPLMLAIQKDNVEMFKSLILKYANTEATYWDIPLILAIKQNNTEMVKCLIGKGANIEATHEYGKTSLAFAIQKNANEKIIEFLITVSAKESVEKIFMEIISDPNNYHLKHIFINNGVNIKKAFANASYIDWESPLVREYALKINHRYSEVIRVLNNKDITIDQYKECFYQAKEVKKAYKDDLIIDEIMKSVFLKAGKELISVLVKETSPAQHKELVKWLNIFGAKFSFYNSDKILLTSQSGVNESQCYNLELSKEEFPDKFINFKKMLKVKVKEGKLYNIHTGNIINEDDNQHLLYVIDKKGQLYIDINKYGILKHSFILNGISQKNLLDGISMFGYGKPVQCGGHLSIKDGVIIKINNDSGHYVPDHNMLKQICQTLLHLGVLAKDSVVLDHEKIVISQDQIENFDMNKVEVSGDYPFLDY